MGNRDAGGGAPPGLSLPPRRACPAQSGWLASAGEAVPPGAESRPRAAPPHPAGRRARARGGQRRLQADREHVTIAQRPASLRGSAGRPRRQSLACPSHRMAHGDDILAAATTEPQLGASDHHSFHGVSGAMMVPHAPEARTGPSPRSAGVSPCVCVGGGNPIVFALRGHCEAIRL